MFDMQKESELKARAAKAAIPDDVTAELVKDAQALGAAQVKGDGMMADMVNDMIQYDLDLNKMSRELAEHMWNTYSIDLGFCPVSQQVDHREWEDPLGRVGPLSERRG